MAKLQLTGRPYTAHAQHRAAKTEPRPSAKREIQGVRTGLVQTWYRQTQSRASASEPCGHGQLLPRTHDPPHFHHLLTDCATEKAETVLQINYTRFRQGGLKSKLLILSKYVSKTGKIGGMWTNMNIYRENGALCDIFTWNISCHNCSMFKYSVAESSQWNYCQANTN